MAASRPLRRSPWADLPVDLLGIVLRSLPSLADRVRLPAVCRPWRSSAATMLHLSPPLVFHEGTLLDVSNNTAHRVRLPEYGAICYCAGENMLFVLHIDGRRSLMNALSRDVTPLPELAALLKARHARRSTGIWKVVMSSAPRLVAVLFSSSSGSGVFTSTCRPPGEINSCQVWTDDRRRVDEDIILDIAFFQGEILAISRYSELLAAQLDSDEQTPRLVTRIAGAPLPSTDSHHGNYEIRRYLVESNGKLLLVIRWVSRNWLSNVRTRRFDVFEADTSRGRWNQVDGLEGQALFVSMLCSKSVPAAAAGGDVARQDCIYFLREYSLRLSVPGGAVRDSGVRDSGKYSIGDRTVTPLLLEETWKNQWPLPAWFFPVEV